MAVSSSLLPLGMAYGVLSPTVLIQPLVEDLVWEMGVMIPLHLAP